VALSNIRLEKAAVSAMWEWAWAFFVVDDLVLQVHNSKVLSYLVFLMVGAAGHTTGHGRVLQIILPLKNDALG
jgi:hypothetical protein